MSADQEAREIITEAISNECEPLSGCVWRILAALERARARDHDFLMNLQTVMTEYELMIEIYKTEVRTLGDTHEKVI